VSALAPVTSDGGHWKGRSLWFDWIVDDESPWKGSYLATAADGALYLVQPPTQTTAGATVPLAHERQPTSPSDAEQPRLNGLGQLD
jgi:hypothetical protein